MATRQFLVNIIWLFALPLLAIQACNKEKFAEEIRITHDLTYNHDLDNNDNFSPDDLWLVYDTRTEEGGIGACSRIEKVNIKTGEKVILYKLKQNQSYGPGVGAVSYSHTDNKVVFIHGLLNITSENPYQQWRRSGVIINDAEPGVPVFMDSRDVTYPYTQGALRGGTHRHEWSRDGGWIGYTYNDAIMKHLEDSTGELHNLRTIGVSKSSRPIKVDEDKAGENINGTWYSTLVVKVVPNPTPGTDEISRAAGDSWVGTSGYKKLDGSVQRARGFIGTIKNSQGEKVDEVFIVDIPEDITKTGTNGPLEGTSTEMPAPPQGASQRRLTYTADSNFPGCTGIVRTSFDGQHMTFQAFDKNGIRQIFTISPLGGEPIQQSFHETDVQSGVRWHPDRQTFCYVWNNSIVIKRLGMDNFTILTQPTDDPPTDLVWSHDGKTIAFNRSVKDPSGNASKQIFIIKL